MVLKSWCLVNLIFCCTLILVDGSESEPNDELTFDFVQLIQPQYYDIHLILTSEDEFHAYNGSVKIKFQSKTNSKVLRFILGPEINITRVKLINLRTVFEADNFTLKRGAGDDVFLVSPSRFIIENREIYELQLDFSNTLHHYYDNRGFFAANSEEVDNSRYILAATHFQTKYIRDAIPTFEDVSFKVPIKMRITHHPKFTALSNMPGRVVAATDNHHLVTTEFEETPPMPGYLLAFAIGNFKSKPVPNERNLPFHLYGSSKIFTETDDATAISGKILIGMEDYFTIPFALPKMDFLILSEFPFYGMENWGLVVFLESKIFGSWKTKKTSDLVLNTIVNAHELAHQYFGNLVTPKQWRYVWLSEGFATFFSYHILDRVFPNDHYDDQFLIDNLFSAFALYEEDTLNSRSEKSSIYDVAQKINYYKSSSIIRMVMHVIGENRFRQATISYLNLYGYKSTVPKDLTSIYHSIVKDDPAWSMDINIETFIESWTHQIGTPILTVRRNYLNGDIELKQQYNNKNNMYDTTQTTWWLPYNYASKQNADFNDTTPTGWMKNESSITINLNLSPNDWIIFNKQFTGVYMVNYDDRNWELLTDELIYGNHELIHQYNRVQLMHDLVQMVQYNKIDRKHLTKLLFYLKREKNYLPWAVGDTSLEKFWNMLQHKQQEDTFKKMVRYITGDAYDHYRLNAQQNDTKVSLLTRVIVVQWACRSGYQNCLQDFENLSIEYSNYVLSNRSIAIHPDIKEFLFCYGFQNETNYKVLFNFFANNQDHPDANEFFMQFNCKQNTKIFRTHYHAFNSEAVQRTATYPALSKIRNIMRYSNVDKISVIYQCLIENCFDFRYNSPLGYAEEVSDLVVNALNPRYNGNNDLPQIKKMLNKIQDVYGIEIIRMIGESLNNRYRYYW